MEISYRLYNPTGNITALVETQVPVEHQPEVAEYIMKQSPSCEQVGYLSGPVEGSDITLRMAGGEFCGNATMSTAACFCNAQGMQNGETRTVNVKVIGTSGLVPVEVTREKGSYYGTISMPKALKIENVKFTIEGDEYTYPVVSFVGISHVIMDDKFPVSLTETAIKLWCDRLKVQGLGFMIVNEKRTILRPLVYVKNTETLVWESSCASGTTAVAAYFAHKDGCPVKLSLKEPGGILTVQTFEDGSVKLSGKVDFQAKTLLFCLVDKTIFLG